LRWWIRFRKDESGASATEYALTLAVIGGCVVCTALALGYAIESAFNNAGECIQSHAEKC